MTLQKIIVTGPESSGKTTLGRALAAQLDVPFVEEYARTYLQHTNGRYQYDDLEKIARGQHRLQQEAGHNYPFIVCDTGLLVMHVWSEFRYQKTASWITEQLAAERQSSHFLLCKPDIPWEPDPLRENPEERELLFDIYLRRLQAENFNFTVVEGAALEKRLEIAQIAVNHFF